MAKEIEKFTKYERARILGARALQISMDAPILLKADSELLSNLNFDPLRIAEKELDTGILPITVKRPMPKRKKENLEKIKIKEEELNKEATQETDGEKVQIEEKESKRISEDGEIMEMASPEDEVFETTSESEEYSGESE